MGGSGCRVEVHAAGPMLSQRDDAVVYQGEGEKFARRLSKVIHGGQVVLSETAWASIQDQIPGQSQVQLPCLLSLIQFERIKKNKKNKRLHFSASMQ